VLPVAVLIGTPVYNIPKRSPVMFKSFKESLRRKRARRITQEYPAKIDTYDLKDEGKIEFANWDNPLVAPIPLSQNMVNFFKKFIKQGDFVIDIGANIGDTTVPMALAAGASGVALGFDPNPNVFKILQANAALNKGKQNIVPLLYAITEKEEEFYYISSEASFANGGISPTKESIHGRFVYPERIKGINLLEFLEKNYSDKVKNLSFIKIDTEGYDKEIIKSISSLLSKYKPAIIAESFGDASREAKMELYDVIARLEYDIFYFDDFKADAKTIKLEKREDITKWKETVNIYATPK
jgi:FkbM family methyltransferase